MSSWTAGRSLSRSGARADETVRFSMFGAVPGCGVLSVESRTQASVLVVTHPKNEQSATKQFNVSQKPPAACQLAQSNILPLSEADRPFSAALRDGRMARLGNIPHCSRSAEIRGYADIGIGTDNGLRPHEPGICEREFCLGGEAAK